MIEDGISSIRRVVQLTDQLSEVEETCKTHEKTYVMEYFQLTDLFAQHTWMQRNTADTSAHASGAVVSLLASGKKSRDEVRVLSCKNEEKLSTETARSDGPKAEVTDLMGLAMKDEELFGRLRSKERMALEKVKPMGS